MMTPGVAVPSRRIHRPSTPEVMRCAGYFGTGALASGKRRGAGGAYDPLSAHSWIVFALMDEAQLTLDGLAVTEAANQGTAGGVLAQDTGSVRPAYSADHYGAGLDAITLDAADFLKQTSVDFGGVAQWTTVWAGTPTNHADYRMALTLGSAGVTKVYAGINSGTGVARSQHDLNVGLSTRIGTTNLAGGAAYVVSRHDVSLASGEVSVDVLGASEDGGAPFDFNNTATIGTLDVYAGIWANESLYGWLGALRFIGVSDELITGTDLDALEEWLAAQVGL